MKRKILLSFFLVSTSIITYSQSGVLDPAFGKGGIVTTDAGVPFNYADSGKQVLIQGDSIIYFLQEANHATVISRRHVNGSEDNSYNRHGRPVTVSLTNVEAKLQSDGKLLIGGSINVGGYPARFRYGIVRLNTDGAVDNTFNNGAMLTTANSGYDYFVGSFDLTSDNKIVIDGEVDMLFGTYDNEVIERYNSDGSADISFNGTGYEVTNALSGYSLVATQPDNKIILNHGYSLVRLNTDGSTDSTFNTNPVRAFVNFNTSTIKIQKDGKIVIAGNAESGANYYFAIARYDSTGNPDSTFGNYGFQTTDFNDSVAFGTSLNFQSDGKIIQGGYAGTTNVNFAFVRYTANGITDSSYGIKGKVETDFGKNDYSNATAIFSNDKLVSLGYTTESATTYLAAAEYNTDGSLDNSFDSAGLLINHLSQGSTRYTCTALQKDGKVVAAGYTWNGSHYNAAAARYNPTDGSLDTSFDSGSIQQSGIDTANNQIYAIAVQNDDKIITGGLAGSQAVLIRYNTNGTLDNTFNGTGILKTDFGAGSYISDIAIQPDGKIVVRSLQVLARFNANGSSDNTFNRASLDDDATSPSASSGLALQKSGKIIASASYGGVSNLLSFNPDGTTDESFGPFGGFVQVGVPEYGGGSGGVYVRNIVTDSSGGIAISINSINLYRATDYNASTQRYDSLGNVEGSLDSRNISFVTSLIQDSSNNLFVAGYHLTPDLSATSVIEKVKANGTYDSSFNQTGFVITPTSLADNNYQGLALGFGALYAAGYGQFPGNLGVVAKYLMASGGPLPVALMDFEASLQNNSVVLTWHTASEQNLSHFVVERSSDGLSFSPIGTVAASGNSTIRLAYTSLDRQPLQGVNFYRLQLVNSDGKVTLSKIVAVTIGQQFIVRVFPNPASNLLLVQLHASGQEAFFEITDAAGRKVQGGTISLNNNISFSLDVSHLAKGAYTLTIKTTSQTISRQFLKE